MDLTLFDICRGTGKLFCYASVRGANPDSLIAIRAFTSSGKESPLMVFESDKSTALFAGASARDFQIVAPLLKDKLHLVAFELAPDGTSIGEAHKSIIARMAKWQSRLNARLHQDSVEQIRNCDNRRTAKRVVIRCWGATATADGRHMLHARAHVPCELAPSTPRLICYDDTLTELCPCTTLAVRKRTDLDSCSTPCWEIEFSASAPQVVSVITFAAVDSSGFPLPGFEALEEWQVESLCARDGYLNQDASRSDQFHSWFTACRPQAKEIARQKQYTLAQAPLICIAVSVSNDLPPRHFDILAQSLFAQTYDNWECVVMLDGTISGNLAERISYAQAIDQRVKAIAADDNRFSSLAKFAASTSGDLLCFFDASALIEPDALFEYAKAMNAHPDAGLIYCDEAQFDDDFRFSAPFFKPDFNIDYLRSFNYLGRTAAIRTDLASTLRDIALPTDSSSAYALTLAACQLATDITHIQKVLYHTRAQTDAPLEPGHAEQDLRACKAVLAQHLRKVAPGASVTSSDVPGAHRVTYPVTGSPFVSILIPNKGNSDALARCIKSILSRSTYDNKEIVIVDYGSIDKRPHNSYKVAPEFGNKIRTVEADNPNGCLSQAINYGWSNCAGEYLLLLNPEAEIITPSWIEELLGVCQRPDVGVVGGQPHYPDHTIQHAGIALSTEGLIYIEHRLPASEPGYFGTSKLMHDVTAVTRTGLMTSRETFEAIGGFDDKAPDALSEIDYCLRVRKQGLLVVYAPAAELINHDYRALPYNTDGNAAPDVQLLRESARFRRRWASAFASGDPFLNRKGNNRPHL